MEEYNKDPRGGKKRGNKPGVHTTKEEKERRIGQAAEWLLHNPDMRYTDFQNHFQEKWGITERMVAHYYKDGGTKASELYDDKIILEKKRATISLMNQLRIAEKDLSKTEDLKERNIIRKEMLSIRQEVNKVLGLYQTNIDVTSGGDKLESFDLSQIVGFNQEEDKEDEA